MSALGTTLMTVSITKMEGGGGGGAGGYESAIGPDSFAN